jgi:hypothetical protein
MTLTRDKNPSKGEAVTRRNTIAYRALGGGVKNDLESWPKPLERWGWEVEETKGFGGAVINMILTRDKNPWKGEAVKLRKLLHVGLWEGRGFKNI